MGTMLTRGWRHLAASVEKVPVFWDVYALILVETVGEGVLAIPIAVAKIGPLAGVGVLILIGVVNMITIASMAEASARNGSIRYGGSYLGRVVQDYLGQHWHICPCAGCCSDPVAGVDFSLCGIFHHDGRGDSHARDRMGGKILLPVAKGPLDLEMELLVC
jgi:Transmembrane amino acid transporter protein